MSILYPRLFGMIATLLRGLFVLLAKRGDESVYIISSTLSLYVENNRNRPLALDDFKQL